MNAFTIRDIENLCGIKAHTLRIWEHRYNIFSPRRKPGNHRTYDSEDLKFLLRVAYLYHQGYKISAIANLSADEINRLALTLLPNAEPADIFINQLTEASLDFDERRFGRILHEIVLHMGFEHAVTKAIFPFLHRIGLLWLTGNVVPAQEHFASALISRRMLFEIDATNVIARPRRTILLFAPTGEFHEIPLLFMRYLMKRSGTLTIYFGVNIAVSEIAFYCRQHEPTHIYFHVVTRLLDEPEDYLSNLQKLVPGKQVVMSGGIVDTLRYVPEGVRVLRSQEEMKAFAME